MPKILTNDDIDTFRSRLCQLALKSFARHGVEGMTLRGLAAAAGCSRTTPYRYFKNKADILAAVRQREFERLTSSLESAIALEPDPDKKLTVLAAAYLRFAVENPDGYRVMYQVSQQDEALYPELMRQIQRSGDPIRAVVKEALASGCLHGDPVNIAQMWWAGLHGLISLHLSHQFSAERDFEELSQVMVRALTRAFARRPSKGPAARRMRQKN